MSVYAHTLLVVNVAPAITDEYRPAWTGDVCRPSARDLASDVGYRLGADGEPAELLTDNDAERRAFDDGHNAGNDYLWRVDPLFAAYLKDRAEAANLLGR